MLALLNSIAYQHTAHGVAPTRIDSATLSHGFARGTIAHVKHTMRRAAPKMSRSFALPRPIQQGVTRAATHQRRRRNLRLHTSHTLSQPPPPPPRTTTLAKRHDHAPAPPPPSPPPPPPPPRTHTHTHRSRRPTTPLPPPSSHTRRPPPARNGGARAQSHAITTRTRARRRRAAFIPPAHARSRRRPCTCRERSLCETQPALYTHDGIFDNFGPRVQVAGSIARGRCLRRGFAMLHATLGRRECAS